jgi:predicted DNA binding CopG/RHH family protein
MALNRKRQIVRLSAPKFRSQAEEAAWWDAHSEAIVKAFEQAYGRKAVQRVLNAPRKPARPITQTVTMRLPVEDVARAKRMASRKGLGYQTLVKSLLHEALLREDRS